MKSPSGARILIVDNDHRVCVDLIEILEPLGYEVQSADGQGVDLVSSALELAHAFRPHVMVLDLRLFDEYRDDRSGVGLWQSVQPARCIFYSAHLSPSLMRDTSDGRTTWVSKREPPQVLLDEIEKTVGLVSAQKRGLAIRWPPGLDAHQIIAQLCPNAPEPPPQEMLADLVAQLLPKSTRIELETLERAVITPAQRSVGRGRAVVLTAWPDDKMEPLILKLAPAAAIAQEAQNYRKQIHGNLRGRFHAVVEGEPVAFWDLGGILYSFVGGQQERIRRFVDFYKGATSVEIREPIRGFFTEVWGRLYSEQRRLGTSLYASYVAPFDLHARLMAAVGPGSTLPIDVLFDPLPNPVHWVLDHRDNSHLPAAREVITHGDLHADNLFTDGQYVWSIDFEYSGWGHWLRDFVALEVDLATRLLPVPAGDLRRSYELALTLAASTSANQALPPPASLADDQEIVKGLEVIADLRVVAREATRCTDWREYVWGLLLNAVFVAVQHDACAAQRERALLLAAALVGRLRGWNDPEWPPEDWPPTLPTIQAIEPEILEEHVDRAVVRDLLRAAFTQETLRRLCQDRAKLRPVVDEFALGHGLNDMIDEVVTYCEKHVLLVDLLAAVKQTNSEQFAFFRPRLLDGPAQGS